MRTIKFRIWDKNRKEWLHDTKHAVNILGETIILGEILARPDGTGVKISELNNLEVMQFTGLHDKNGKEIFEGDIIEEGGKKRLIVWDDEHAKFVNGIIKIVKELTPNVDVFGLKAEKKYTDDLPMKHENCEIIGNIFENSNLLKSHATLYDTIKNALKENIIDEETAEELLADPKKAEEWLAKGEV